MVRAVEIKAHTMNPLIMILGPTSAVNAPGAPRSGSGTRRPGAPKAPEATATLAKPAKWRQRPLSPVGLWALFEAR